MNTLRPDASGDARPTVPYRRCACGGAEDPTHRCIDPVAEIVAARVALARRARALPLADRLRVEREVAAVLAADTTARLAAGPP